MLGASRGQLVGDESVYRGAIEMRIRETMVLYDRRLSMAIYCLLKAILPPANG